jgi:hypothetical protein
MMTDWLNNCIVQLKFYRDAERVIWMRSGNSELTSELYIYIWSKNFCHSAYDRGKWSQDESDDVQ